MGGRCPACVTPPSCCAAWSTSAPSSPTRYDQTCSHSDSGIRATGLPVPRRHPIAPGVGGPRRASVNDAGHLVRPSRRARRRRYPTATYPHRDVSPQRRIPVVTTVSAAILPLTVARVASGAVAVQGGLLRNSTILRV
eukprot:5857404-Pyramimonas_sp.AAC.1